MKKPMHIVKHRFFHGNNNIIIPNWSKIKVITIINCNVIKRHVKYCNQ